jgi:SEC-C motif-containing protein
MRSRYSAFVLCNEQYLLATWHPSKRPDSIPFDKNRKWLGLRIVDVRVTGDASAEVESRGRKVVLPRWGSAGAAAAEVKES